MLRFAQIAEKAKNEESEESPDEKVKEKVIKTSKKFQLLMQKPKSDSDLEKSSSESSQSNSELEGKQKNKNGNKTKSLAKAKIAATKMTNKAITALQKSATSEVLDFKLTYVTNF